MYMRRREIDKDLLPAGEGQTLLIDGEWRRSRELFDVRDPATLEVIGSAADGTVDEARAAGESAVAAFDGWRGLAAEERSARLRRGLDAIRERSESLARLLSLENGKPVREARGEILRGAAMLEWGIEEGRRVYGRVTPSSSGTRGVVLVSPVGPALVITPWNFPASMLMRKMGLSLSAGSPVIAKPAEQTPLIAVAIAKILNEFLPAGVVNVVTTSRPGEVVDELMKNPRIRKVTFTGSTEVGLRLLRTPTSILKRVSLELGGHTPAIVFADADVEAAIDSIMMAKFSNAGQSCISINRLFVHSDVRDAVVAGLRARIGRLQIGHGFEEETSIGPLIDANGLEKVERHVADARARGAEVLIGGSRWHPDDDTLRGEFFEPTLLAGVDESMIISKEETFGPVLPVFEFTDDDDVIAQANNTTYGLSAYLFGTDFDVLWDAMERLEFGVIGVNEVMPNRPELPFGGFKNSGQGREGGSEGIEDYVETKAVAIRVGRGRVM